MKTLKYFLVNPAVQAILILAACIYMLNSTSSRFFSAVHEDRDNMVKSLRQADVPGLQITAISAGFDNITMDVNRLAVELFSFTTIAFTVCFLSWRRSAPACKDSKQHKDKLTTGEALQ
jgi:hypothetical protein